MSRDAAQPPSALGGPALKLAGEDQHRELALLVGGPGIVAPLALKVVEGDPPLLMGEAGERDDPRLVPGCEQGRQQARRQREMAEVVGAELLLEPVAGDAPGRKGHDARIVDEDVERRAAISSAKRATEARSARSSGTTRTSAPGTAAVIRASAASAFARLRAARMTRAPRDASPSAVSKPSPPDAPVTTGATAIEPGSPRKRPILEVHRPIHRHLREVGHRPPRTRLVRDSERPASPDAMRAFRDDPSRDRWVRQDPQP